VYSLVGSNGAGKTTLLACLAFLRQPAAGKYAWQGQTVDRQAVSLGLRQQIALVEQSPFFFDLSARDNLLLGFKWRGIKGAAANKLIGKPVKQLGLEALLDRPANQLSGGEYQRLALARALALQPQLLLLDEPTQNVDRGYTQVFLELLSIWRQSRQMTVVFASHDQMLAQLGADQVLSLLDGHLIESFPDNLFQAQIVTEPDGDYIYPSPSIRLAIAPGYSGNRLFILSSSDIIVSREPLASSARNVFKARLQSMIDQQGILLIDFVVYDQKKLSNFHLKARVTQPSCQALGMQVGGDFYLAFKATAMQVF